MREEKKETKKRRKKRIKSTKRRVKKKKKTASSRIRNPSTLGFFVALLSSKKVAKVLGKTQYTHKHLSHTVLDNIFHLFDDDLMSEFSFFFICRQEEEQFEREEIQVEEEE